MACARGNCPRFRVRGQAPRWVSTIRIMEKRRRLCSMKTSARGRDDVVFAHLGHRLVQLSLGLLRAEIWALADANTSTIDGGDETTIVAARRAKINRVTVRTMKGARFDTPIVIAHGRLVVLGQDNARLHEEVIRAGGALRAGRLFAFECGRSDCGHRSPNARRSFTSHAKSPARHRGLKSKIPCSVHWKIECATAQRIWKISLTTVRSIESAHLRAVLEELAASIRREIFADEPQQLELWSNEEQLQLQRNRDALKVRLDAIPG